MPQSRLPFKMGRHAYDTARIRHFNGKCGTATVNQYYPRMPPTASSWREFNRKHN